MQRNGVEYWGEYPVSLAELEALPTLCQGQADDLKIESDTERVWLARCTVEDGEPWNNKVTIERRIGGSWVEVENWQAVGGSSDDDDGEFQLSIEVGNDAMSTARDIAGALRTVADDLEEGHGSGRVRDLNGNTVGSWSIDGLEDA